METLLNKSFVSFTCAAILATTALYAAGEEMKGAPSEAVHRYAAVGRVKWHFPSRFEYYFAHPHRTMGPRIVCSGKRYECEISVLSRELPKATADRQEQLRRAMVQDRFNTTPVTVHSVGALHSIHYVLLTDPGQRYGNLGALGQGYRFMLSGFAEKGPALVSFQYYANDEAEFAPLLAVVERAEVTDAVGVLAWRLGDLKAVCEERYPLYKAGNDSAFAASSFAAIDVPSAVKTAMSLPDTVEDIRSKLVQARAGFASSFDAEGPERGEAICKTFPQVLAQSMNGISSSR